MTEICKGNVLTDFLRANGPTINGKINKLINCIESEKSHKSIVLLLIELAEHHDLSSETTISLQYYLDMFQNLEGEPPLSETGILLLNSAIIYGRSVDTIHFTVKKLLFSLINPENKSTERVEENLDISIPHVPNAVIKGRKRSLSELKKNYEIEMSIKRFKSISNNNRFEEDISFPCQKHNEIIENVVKSSMESWIKDYTNPLSCLFSSIEEFDEDGVEFKKKYRLLTNHLEHRYNTLTPDINFKMYFKIKDYIDAVYNDSSNTDMWPPLSDAYIQYFVNLENQILQIKGYKTGDEYENDKINKADDVEVLTQCGAGVIEIIRNPIDSTAPKDNDILKINNDHNLNIFPCKTSLSSPSLFMQEDFSSLCRDDLCQSVQFSSKGNNFGEHKQSKNNLNKSREDLTAVRLILPHLDDEGVYFSELDSRDQQLLSPAVIATDMFRCVKDKTNVVVIIDDVLKRIYNIQEPKAKMLLLPILSSREKSFASLNFLKIDHKCFKRRRPFKLGPDFHLLQRERLNTISGKRYQSNHSEMYFRLCEDVTRVPMSPASSPNYEPDFLGFPDDISLDKNRSLSRDSGISLQIPEIIEQDLNVDSNMRCRLLELSEDCSKKTNTIELEKNGISFESFVEEQNAFPQSFSLDKFLIDDEYNHSEIEKIPHIIIANSATVTDNIASLMTKVQQWHLHLKPLLMQSKDRHHFDIIKLGTDILNHFEENNQRDSIISFQKLMENKDSSLVSRYFLSTLLLANQGNISINISHPNTDVPADLNSIGLRLLNKRICTYSGEEENEIISSSVLKGVKKKCVSVACATIRTLQQSYTTSTRDEHDSGVSMSDGSSI